MLHKNIIFTCLLEYTHTDRQRQKLLFYAFVLLSQAVGFVGDVRKQEDAKRVIESTFKHFGRIDILVNAAAGNFLVSAEDLSPNGFRTGMYFSAFSTGLQWHRVIKQDLL